MICNVAVVIEGGLHIKVIAPTGEFNSVVTHFLNFWQELDEWQIGPLAGEESDWSWHNIIWFLRISVGLK